MSALRREIDWGMSQNQKKRGEKTQKKRLQNKNKSTHICTKKIFLLFFSFCCTTKQKTSKFVPILSSRDVSGVGLVLTFCSHKVCVHLKSAPIQWLTSWQYSTLLFVSLKTQTKTIQNNNNNQVTKALFDTSVGWAHLASVVLEEIRNVLDIKMACNFVSQSFFATTQPRKSRADRVMKMSNWLNSKKWKVLTHLIVTKNKKKSKKTNKNNKLWVSWGNWIEKMKNKVGKQKHWERQSGSVQKMDIAAMLAKVSTK